MCADGGHDWQPTGHRGIHAEFPTKTNGVRHLAVMYFRCVRCGQDGFRKNNGGRVIYTWSKED